MTFSWSGSRVLLEVACSRGQWEALVCLLPLTLMVAEQPVSGNCACWSEHAQVMAMWTFASCRCWPARPHALCPQCCLCKMALTPSSCRRLLAKMVLLREEVQQMLVEAAFLGSGGALSPEHAALELPFRQLGAVPRSCAVFLQRLMTLSSPSER